MATPYQLAADMAGTREGQAALTDYLRTGGQNIDPTTRAWCADFVNATMSKAGQKGTDSGMARSFLKWGQSVTEPQQGDVAVFSRGSDPSKGHVGFFDSVNPDGSIRVLGGNQSDSVSYGNYPAERLLGYRRPANPDERMGGDSMVPKNQSPQIAAQTNTPQPQGDAWGGMRQTPPEGLMAMLGNAGDKMGEAASNPLLAGLMAGNQAPEPMQLQPMAPAQQTTPSLTDYLAQFMKSRMI